jgi:nicotinamidase-related amidase
MARAGREFVSSTPGSRSPRGTATWSPTSHCSVSSPSSSACGREPPGTKIIDELEPRADDWIVTNTKVSAFAASDLDERLRGAGIDTVVLFGVATNLSVESTGRSAGDLGYRVVLVADACEAATDQAHVATLASFALLGEVVAAEEVLAAL